MPPPTDFYTWLTFTRKLFIKWVVPACRRSNGLHPFSNLVRTAGDSNSSSNDPYVSRPSSITFTFAIPVFASDLNSVKDVKDTGYPKVTPRVWVLSGVILD